MGLAARQSSTNSNAFGVLLADAIPDTRLNKAIDACRSTHRLRFSYVVNRGSERASVRL